jgi:hypothetical protein
VAALSASSSSSEAEAPTTDGSVASVIAMATPLLVAAQSAFEASLPYIMVAIAACVRARDAIRPYDEASSIALGLALLFFGGMYTTFVAAVEAYRLVGWESSKRGVTVLYAAATAALAASRKDDDVDADNDGVADVKQMQSQSLIAHKVRIVAAAVDPTAVRDALAGVGGGLFAGWVCEQNDSFAFCFVYVATVSGACCMCVRRWWPFRRLVMRTEFLFYVVSFAVFI